MNTSITFDYKDIWRVKQSFTRLGEKTTLKAAKKAAQKGSNVVGKAIRSAAPVGKTGQLKRGFKKKAEHSRLQGKFVYQYAMDSSKNDIFQKPIIHVGKYGGKSKHGYYPASVEYGFLTSSGSAGGGYRFIRGRGGSSKEIDGTHFVESATETASGAAVATMHTVLNAELDKEWAKK